MNCEAASTKIVETCRRRARPDAATRAHLDGCPACEERWREQEELSGALRVVRLRSAGERAPEALRGTLLREFEARKAGGGRQGFGRRWLWSVAAAAIFVVAALVIPDLAKKPAPVAAEVAYEDADPREEGFIEVPFAPPLAEGETVRVVHTELRPAELASMGVNVDPSWTTELPADVLVGQDGFPRAVRGSDESSAESSSDSGS